MLVSSGPDGAIMFWIKRRPAKGTQFNEMTKLEVGYYEWAYHGALRDGEKQWLMSMVYVR